MIIIIVFSVFLLALKFQPNIEYIEESKMWICHYNNNNNTRKYFIIYKDGI